MTFRVGLLLLPVLAGCWLAGFSVCDEKTVVLFLGDSITEAEFFVRDFEAAWNGDAGNRSIRAIPRGRGG